MSSYLTSQSVLNPQILFVDASWRHLGRLWPFFVETIRLFLSICINARDCVYLLHLSLSHTYFTLLLSFLAIFIAYCLSFNYSISLYIGIFSFYVIISPSPFWLTVSFYSICLSVCLSLSLSHTHFLSSQCTFSFQTLFYFIFLLYCLYVFIPP